MLNLLLEHIPCDLCGCNKYKVRYRKPDTSLWLNQFEYPVVECINCGLVFVNPRPTELSMADFYSKNYHDNRDNETHLKRYKIQLEFLPKLNNEKILDIGCARGDWLIYLKNIYPDISLFGVDSYSKKVNSKDICFYNNKLTECNFESKKFDLVTSWAVFEHLHYPGKYFEEVSRILKPNGKFIFLVTNSESFYGKKAYLEDIPRHTYHYSKKTIQKYAEKYDFKMNNIFYDDRIFDGRGIGTFYYKFLFGFGGNWEKIYFNKLNIIQKLAGRIGYYFDRIFFKNHWESKIKKSGIIIVEFQKKEI